MRFSILLIFCGLLLSSCSDITSPINFGQIDAKITKDYLNISNNSEATIYYFAIDQEFAAKANWHASSTEENAIKSQEMAKLPISEIVGYNPGNVIILYYWMSESRRQNEISHILVSN